MAASMPREKGDTNPVQLAEHHLVGRSPEGGFDRAFRDLPKPFDVVQPAAADDPDVCVRCVPLSRHPWSPSVARNRSTCPITSAAVCWTDSGSLIVNH